MNNKQLVFCLLVGAALLGLGVSLHGSGSVGVSLIALGAVLSALSIVTRAKQSAAVSQFLPVRMSRSMQKS